MDCRDNPGLTSHGIKSIFHAVLGRTNLPAPTSGRPMVISIGRFLLSGPAPENEIGLLSDPGLIDACPGWMPRRVSAQLTDASALLKSPETSGADSIAVALGRRR